MSIRGLPDERPRPSVANLIGRFEQRASKRQSIVGPGGGPASASPTASPSQSRSTSVTSHFTGDSAAIEIKERREWPPQQYRDNSNNSSTFGNVTNGSGNGNGNAVEGLPAATVNAPSMATTTTTTTFSVAELRRSLEKSVVGDSMRGIVKSPPPNTSSDVQDAAPPVSAPDEVKEQVEVEAASPPPTAAIPEPAPVIEEVKSDTEKKASTSPVRATGKVAASKSTNTRSTGGTTGKTATTPRPSAITQSKSTSSTPQATKTSTAAPSATKPLTAQRTGNSTASAAAVRAGAKSPPVSTPLRAKTPTARGVRASTSGSQLKAGTDRAKTPTVSPARAKTPTALSASGIKHAPSSGLYAPTKASLARARNAGTPPPPVPKPAVSASSLERLMKPTAASASKVRGPAPTSPPRATPKKVPPTSPPSSISGTRKVVKPRVGLAPARMKEEKERKEKAAAKKTAATRAGAAAAGAAIAAQSASEDEHDQPSFISTTGVSDVSQSLSHEEHGPPSDIESYDDAFASDDERAMELDRAHLVTSARPSTEGEQEAFTGVGTPEPAVPHSEAESDRSTSESAPVESKLEINTAAESHKVSTPKQNGFSASEPSATTEFDSVLNMLAVKPPPRAASPGVIPDEEL